MSGKVPTVWQRFRQTLGRAFRETGQALDRLGVKTAALATTKYDYYDDPVIYEDHLSRHRQRFPLLWSGKPLVHRDVAYLAPCSTLIGSVHVGKGSSIWYGAVLRADECANAASFNVEYKYNEDDASSEQKGGGMALVERSNVGDPDDFASLSKPWRLTDERYSDRIDHHGGGIFIGNNTNVQDNCVITSRVHHTIIGNGVTIGHLAQIHSATIEDFCLIGMGSIIQEGAVIETEAFIAAGAVISKNQIVKSGELWVGNPARKIRNLTQEERQKLHYQSSEYVLVATAQNGVMELGGNVSDLTDETAKASIAAAASNNDWNESESQQLQNDDESTTQSMDKQQSQFQQGQQQKEEQEQAEETRVRPTLKVESSR